MFFHQKTPVSLQAYQRVGCFFFGPLLLHIWNRLAVIVAETIPMCRFFGAQSFQRCSRKRWTARKNQSEVDFRSGSSKWTACLNPVSTITVCTIKRLRPRAASPGAPSVVWGLFSFSVISFFPDSLPHNTQLCWRLSACGVRTCDEKLYGLHPSERKLLPRPVCENCLAAPLEIETAAAISGFDGRRLTSRWQMRLKRVVVGQVRGCGWGGVGGALCKVGIIAGFDNPLSRRGEK